MMYLIGQLAVWLLLTALFAAFAGWAFASVRAEPVQDRLQKDRDKLVSELSTLASGEARSEGVIKPDAESVRSLSAIREARLAELERTSQEQRARADDLAAQLAEAQRGVRSPEDAEELQRLRAQVAAHEEERARIVDADVTPAPVEEAETEDSALQGWRLRYFERRVQYLEGLQAPAASASAAPAPVSEAPVASPPIEEWRAREAEARAAFLADELRRAEAPRAAPVAEAASPFAADADTDVLLRWRMLYLERRVAHLQAQAAAVAAPVPAPAAALVDTGPDIDRWKWRARYLESRVRHLESRADTAPQALAQPVAVQTAPAIAAERPPGLPAAHDGAPDDFTLIDDISPLQQTTLYSLGIYHFDQIAAWTPANVAWVDRYLRLQGRIGAEEWLEQAADLAREGPEAARRVSEDETA
jgi:predicted flap endonuclease-1-like 5' DNA nuclease/TolA-binding protein